MKTARWLLAVAMTLVAAWGRAEFFGPIEDYGTNAGGGHHG